MIRDTVREFARNRLAPFAAEWDRKSEFPKAALSELANMGIFGVTVPEEWGGAGLDAVSLALVSEEIAAGDGATSYQGTDGRRADGLMPRRARREGALPRPNVRRQRTG